MFFDDVFCTADAPTPVASTNRFKRREFRRDDDISLLLLEEDADALFHLFDGSCYVGCGLDRSMK